MQINEAPIYNVHEGKIVHCEIKEPIVFRKLIKTLASMLRDTNISFLNNQTTIKNIQQDDTSNKSNEGNISGIEIIELSESQDMIIYVKLKEKNISNFYCSKPRHIINVNLAEFHNYLKLIENDKMYCTVKLSIDENNENYLNVEADNDQLHKKIIICLNHNNIKKYNIKTPEWATCVIMKCSEFYKVCLELNCSIEDFVQITCTKDELSFSCFSKISNTFPVMTYKNQNENYNDSTEKIKIIWKNDDTIEPIIKNVYKLNKLMSFNKCSNMCDNIKIFLADQRPIYIEYAISSLGKAVIGLSPVMVEKTTVTSQ